jgi:hypothetical protein
MTELPDVIDRYLAAAARKDATALADCFIPDGTVVDEGTRYTGASEIRGWREQVNQQWEYTTTIIDRAATGPAQYRVRAEFVGTFPGGRAELAFDFALADPSPAALIESLRIEPVDARPNP